MRKLLWLFSGVVIGFFAAHFANQTIEGRRFFGRVNRGLDELGRAFATGYHRVETETDEVLDDVDAALRDLRDSR